MNLNWEHGTIMSTAADGSVVVVESEEGWNVYPFGLDSGAHATCDSREEAIQTAEAAIGAAACCAGVGDCN